MDLYLNTFDDLIRQYSRQGNLITLVQPFRSLPSVLVLLFLSSYDVIAILVLLNVILSQFEYDIG